MFDVTRPQTFLDVLRVLPTLFARKDPYLKHVITILGSQSDLQRERKVHYETGKVLKVENNRSKTQKPHMGEGQGQDQKRGKKFSVLLE